MDVIGKRESNKFAFQEEQNGTGHAVQAVSYTHLRAHETVLDLVCRLLLEKKKNNKTNHHIN